MATYYTSAYKDAVPTGVASQADVKRLQSELNQGGAGLKVDGIWGPLTDSAYKSYAASQAAALSQQTAAPAYQQASYAGYAGGSALAQMGYQQPPAYAAQPASLERLSYSARSDADIQAEAAGKVNPTYDRYLLNLDKGYARDREEYAFAQEDLARQKEDLTAQTGAKYAEDRAYLEAGAAARGMGRSSYVAEVTGRSMREENAALARIGENWQFQHNRLNTAIARLTEDYSSAKAQGEREWAEKLSAEISRLKDQDRELGYEIQKFNADQGYREASINRQIEQMRYESEMAAWKLEHDAVNEYREQLMAAQAMQARLAAAPAQAQSAVQPAASASAQAKKKKPEEPAAAAPEPYKYKLAGVNSIGGYVE